MGNYRLTVRAVNAWGQQGDPASVSFRIAAPAAPSRIELTPGYFQITATPHLAFMTRRYSLSSGSRKSGLPISGRLKPQPAILVRRCTG
ncbi:phage tail tip protein J-related protein [Escherichia coli]|uniref:phage tail tip protein J-related protein n=1 Tax=Escherichia coli TaxID=562 RepID=UPI003D80A563